MKSSDLSGWIQRFFREYLSRQRNVSPATIASYRDTFRLLLHYLCRGRRRPPAALPLENLTADTVLGFLNDLEKARGNTIRTRN